MLAATARPVRAQEGRIVAGPTIESPPAYSEAIAKDGEKKRTPLPLPQSSESLFISVE